MEYKKNSNVVYSCKYHVVWCPKYRRKVLVNGVDVCLKELIQSICREHNFGLVEMEVMPDHVHLLIEVDPQFGIHKAVKLIKGTTSRIRWAPSSKACHVCGTINTSLTLKQRSWECDCCHATLDRDTNAAINIKRMGLTQLGIPA